MQADPDRKPGFYWVRFEGEIQVMEYKVEKRQFFTKTFNSPVHGWWLCAGSRRPYFDREICELLSDRLEPPAR